MKSIIKKIFKLANKKIYSAFTIASICCISYANVNAKEDPMEKALTESGDGVNRYLQLVGSYGAGIVFALCGLAALIIAGICAWKSRKGTDGVWDETLPAIIILGCVSLASGIVSAVFFNK